MRRPAACASAEQARAASMSVVPGRYRYPWRPDNQFQLLVDGDSFYPAMLGAITGAERYILLETYLISSGTVNERFLQALQEATRRGVTVYALLDAFGALGLNRADRERLAAAGIELRYFNPLSYRNWLRNLRRDHRKLLLVDGRIAFVGGAGITDDFAPEHGRGWHDVVVQIRGPVLADWEALFVDEWRHSTGAALVLPKSEPRPAGKARGRVAISRAFRTQEVKRSLVKQIRNAEDRVWLATAYFLPSWKIRRALGRAAARGVDVRLLLPGPDTDHPSVRHAGRRHYTRLLRRGVRVFEYLPNFLHAKAYLCDEWTSIGSSNMDRWNLRWNLEANQEVIDRDFAAGLAAMFEQDFARSTEWTYERWIRRPWHQRAQEWLWGYVDIILERLGQLRR